MKILFSVAAALTLLLGVTWIFFPEDLLSLWRAEAEPVAIYMSRRYGVLFLGYAVVFWLARRAEASSAKSAILAGGTVVTLAMAVMSLIGALSGVVGPLVWSAVVIEVVLGAAFLYYLVRSLRGGQG